MNKLKIMNDDRIEHLRNTIIGFLSETRKLDKTLTSVSVRHYKMTREEYEESKAKKYTFNVFYGKLNDKSEGFVYNILTLIKEKFIVVSDKVCYLPILLSPERWNYLENKYTNINEYTNITGLLKFPLYFAELTYIFSNIKSNPTLNCSGKECELTPESKIEKYKKIELFDYSSSDRFGFKDSKQTESNIISTKPSPDVDTNPIENQKTISENETSINFITKRIDETLKSVGVDNEDITNILYSQDMKLHINYQLNSKVNRELIISNIIDDALKRFIL